MPSTRSAKWHLIQQKSTLLTVTNRSRGGNKKHVQYKRKETNPVKPKQKLCTETSLNTTQQQQKLASKQPWDPNNQPIADPKKQRPSSPT